ncbi:MAG TPA: lysylphosphatidylglycerol synthase transmembrane domain-containing protein [Kofleriaceae bacterium]|nr:lysylphosphatidylglycerol synthase transmembrane domain-containing protein [Kofleriaceae bacterium]
MTTRVAINVALSLAMLAACVWLLWPDAATRAEVMAAATRRELWPYIGGCVGLMAAVHLSRSLRWHNLLAPIGVRIDTPRLLAISSVGYLAILALPARLGELVRPGLIRQQGHASASAALGTVAVERVVDGLLISLFVFGAFFAERGQPGAPGWMMPTAYVALARPEATVDFALTISLLPRVAPSAATRLRGKLLDMIRGLSALRDRNNMLVFLAWTIVYWTCNGLCVWLLARGFGLDLSVIGGLAVIGVVGVGVSLPNAPGLFGQFQWFTMLGISVYLGPEVLQNEPAHPLYVRCFAFANVLYATQIAWYVAMGALGLATKYVSFADLRRARRDRP